MKHVILGNGPAGVLAAETLRRTTPNDDIVMVGCEDAPPYSRMAIPYMLMNRIGEHGTYLRKDDDHFRRLGISLINAKAITLDDKARRVGLDNGTTLDYDRLLIATGATPIVPNIPGFDLPDVHTCWTLDDARSIIAKTAPGKRVLQVGAGFIGCIIMESLAERGIHLTVVEMGDRMVPRMMTPTAGNMIRRWVEKKGVRVITGTKVERIVAGTPMRAHLSNGDEIECDLVIASAGVRPNLDFLAGSSVNKATGIIVDNRLATNVPEIYAAGDVVESPEFGTGKSVVYAIQPDAADQARTAALNMAGQHALSQGSLAMNVLDSMGLISSSFGQWEGAPGGDNVETVDEANWRYLSLQFLDDTLIGATAIGLTQHVGALRGLIQNRTRLGTWKAKLHESPGRFVEAYVSCSNAKPLAAMH
jgi:NAD(P)H-nitrite reductase large subunit